MAQLRPLRYLNVNSDEEVGEKFDVEELAPGRAEVEYKFIENLLVNFDP